MTKKTLCLVLLLGGAALAAAVGLTVFVPGVTSSLLSFPLEPVGKGISALFARGGVFGGLGAMFIAAGALLPLLLLLKIVPGKGASVQRAAALVLVPVAAFTLFVSAVPAPFTPAGLTPAMTRAAANVTLWSFVFVFLAVLFVRKTRSADEKGLVSALKFVLAGVSLCFLLEAFTAIGGLITELTDRLTLPDRLFAVLRVWAGLLPRLFGLAAVFPAFGLLDALSGDDRLAAAKSANSLTKCSAAGLVVSLFVLAVVNLAQTVFLKTLPNSSVTSDVPLLGIVFFVLSLALTRLVEVNRRLKDDNDLFI